MLNTGAERGKHRPTHNTTLLVTEIGTEETEKSGPTPPTTIDLLTEITQSPQECKDHMLSYSLYSSGIFITSQKQIL